MHLHNSEIVSAVKRFRPLVALIKNVQRRAGLLARPLAVSRYLRESTVRKLQIGAHVCALPGWLNTDLYPQTIRSVTLDATKAFPFPDGSFDYVFSEHQMEHIGYGQAIYMLRQCHRILRTGGKIRIAVPSLDRIVNLFQSARSDTQQRYIRCVASACYPEVRNPWPCFAANAAFMNWGHRFLYDQETLEAALLEVGFSNVQFFAPGQSNDSNLSGIETRMSEMDGYETMVAQATR
jgi:predicted SAM-dependent methyltransferase